MSIVECTLISLRDNSRTHPVADPEIVSGEMRPWGGRVWGRGIPLPRGRGLGRPQNFFSTLNLKMASFGALWDAGGGMHPPSLLDPRATGHLRYSIKHSKSNLLISFRVFDGAEMWHEGMAACAADGVTSVHVGWVRQLVEFDGDYIRISLTPFLLITLIALLRSCSCSCIKILPFPWQRRV